MSLCDLYLEYQNVPGSGNLSPSVTLCKSDKNPSLVLRALPGSAQETEQEK